VAFIQRVPGSDEKSIRLPHNGAKLRLGTNQQCH